MHSVGCMESSCSKLIVEAIMIMVFSLPFNYSFFLSFFTVIFIFLNLFFWVLHSIFIAVVAVLVSIFIGKLVHSCSSRVALVDNRSKANFLDKMVALGAIIF